MWSTILRNLKQRPPTSTDGGFGPEVDGGGVFGLERGDSGLFMGSRERDWVEFEHMSSSNWLLD